MKMATGATGRCFLTDWRLCSRESGKYDDAIAAYKQMEQLGGEYQARGAEGQVDAFRDAHQWKAALDASAAAAKAMPDNRDVQLNYARQLADNGKLDEGVEAGAGAAEGHAG